MLPLPSSINIQQPSGMIETLIIDNEFATAEIALFGAHMLSFKPKHDQRERLFVSEASIRDGKKAIRGGIPVCWPWFGGLNDGYQMHGYARDRVWTLVSAEDTAEGTILTFTLTDTLGDGFVGEATLSLHVCIGQTLSMQLTTTNIGSDDFELSTALHTYFSVENIHDVELVGLSGEFSDKVNNWEMGTTPSPYLFPSSTDRIHFHPAKHLSIIEDKTETKIDSSGHDSIVVWNPGAEIAASMSDMTDNGYLNMLCVETAVTQGKTLTAGEVHTLSLIVH